MDDRDLTPPETEGEQPAGTAPAVSPHLHLVDELPERPDEAEPLTRDEMLEQVPLALEIWEDVDLDAADPALTDSGTRLCIAARKAGGRCTVRAMHDSLTCPVHGGRLDSAAGGHARARALREKRENEENRTRLARMGTRAVVADTLLRKHTEVARAIEVLADAAAEGDLKSAQALIPWLNQGLGMPTERVQVSTPGSVDEVAAMSTDDLLALVEAHRKTA